MSGARKSAERYCYNRISASRHTRRCFRGHKSPEADTATDPINPSGLPPCASDTPPIDLYAASADGHFSSRQFVRQRPIGGVKRAR